MKSAIQNIVPHAFGHHTGCSETWCQYKKDPPHYCHRDLPYGKDLQGDSLQSALKSLFDEYSSDIVINKLAPAANSQRNESLESLNIEPGFFCVDYNTKMDKKISMDKQRKLTVAFKKRRSQLDKHKISETSKKEAKEGTMYESGIGLNLNSSAASMELSFLFYSILFLIVFFYLFIFSFL